MSRFTSSWSLRRAFLLPDGRTVALCTRERQHGGVEPCAVVLEACGTHATTVDASGCAARRRTETMSGPAAPCVALALAFRNTYCGAPLLPFVYAGGDGQPCGAGGCGGLVRSPAPLAAVRWSGAVEVAPGPGGGSRCAVARAVNSEHTLYYPLDGGAPARVVRVVSLARVQGAPPSSRAAYARVSQALPLARLPGHFRPAVQAVLEHQARESAARLAAALALDGAGDDAPPPPPPYARGARAPLEAPLGSAWQREGAGGVESGARYSWGDVTPLALETLRRGLETGWLPRGGAAVDWTEDAVHVLCDDAGALAVEIILPEASDERLCLTADGFVRRTDASGAELVFAFDAFPVTFAHAREVAHAAVVLESHLAQDAAPRAPPPPPPALEPRRLVEEADVPGWGRFCAYSDGMVRGAFVDNTLLKLWWSGGRVKCAAVLASGEELEVVPMRSAAECGVPELQPYVAAALEFGAWVALPAEERARTLADRARMEAEVARFMRERAATERLREAEMAVEAGWQPPLTMAQVTGISLADFL